MRKKTTNQIELVFKTLKNRLKTILKLENYNKIIKIN